MDNAHKKIPTKRKSGNKNRDIGHNAERIYAQLFRQLGFPYCRTTREASALLDSCGIDLDGIPIVLQSKAGAQRGMSPTAELKYIEQRIQEKLPPDSEWAKKPRILIHHKPVGKGFTRNKYHDMVHLTLEDFVTIFKLAYCNGKHSNTTGDTGLLQQPGNESESIEDTN